MSGSAKRFWAFMALMAMFCAIVAWPIYKKLHLRAASAAAMERTKQAVDKDPQLKADWDKAMVDGVLTWPVAKAILERAVEKDPQLKADWDKAMEDGVLTWDEMKAIMEKRAR